MGIRRIKKSWARKAETVAAKVNRGLRSTRRAVSNMTSALSRPKEDPRPIVITGRNAAGEVVATDRTDSHWKAQQIAAAWKASGWAVEIVETGAASGPNSAGPGSRGEPSGEVLGHPGASVLETTVSKVAESQ